MIRRGPLAALLFLLLPELALAQKTDVLVLQNQDRITGEIKSYSQGRLSVDTPHAGVVSVKWNHIVSISSAKQFDVETVGGEHLYGALAPSDPPGKLVIVSGPQAVTITFFEVFNLTPVHQRFWRRWDGSLSLGFNYTQSSNLTQFNLAADATFRRQKDEFVAELSSFFSHQDNVTATERGTFGLRYDRFLPKRWLLEAGVGLDRNIQLGLKLRVLAGIGGGRNLIQTNQTLLTAFAGISANHEQPVDGEAKYNAEAIVGGRYSYFMYDFPKVTLSAAVSVYPSLTTAGRVRLEAAGAAKREIVNDLYLSLSLFDSFDSKDPSTGTPRNDWGPTISVGWTF